MSEEVIKYIKKNHINLSQDEIRELFNDRESNKDKIAKTQLAMVMHLAKKYEYINPSKTLDELISDGMLGLNSAILYYDSSKCTDFAAFAYTSIRHAIYEYRMDNEIIQPSTREKRRQLRDDETPAPKATRMDGYSASDNFDFLEVYDSKDEEYVEFDYNELCRVIKDVLKPDYADIVIASYGLCGRNDKLTMEMVGEMMNTTKQASNQKKHNALNKLKNSPIFLDYVKSITE